MSGTGGGGGGADSCGERRRRDADVQKMDRVLSGAAKMVVIGPTGSGKSSLIQAVLDLIEGGSDTYPDGQRKPPGPKAVAAMESVTVDTMLYDGQLSDGKSCILIDTPGLGDDKGRDSEHIANMVRGLKAAQTVNAFLLVISGNDLRLSGHHKSMIGVFAECFGPDFMKNVAIVKTSWHEDRKARRRRAKLMADLEKDENEAPKLRKLGLSVGCTYEEYVTAQLREQFDQDYGYNQALPCIFIDSMPDIEDQDEVAAAGIMAKHQAALGALAVLTQLPAFECHDIQAVKTLLDRAKDQVEQVKAANEAMEEQLEKERAEAAAKEAELTAEAAAAAKAAAAGEARAEAAEAATAEAETAKLAAEEATAAAEKKAEEDREKAEKAEEDRAKAEKERAGGGFSVDLGPVRVNLPVRFN